MSLYDKSRYSTLFATVAVAAWASVLALGACNDEGLDSKAASTLKKMGYTPVEVGGFPWSGGCPLLGTSTRFKGKGPSGEDVSGAVCEDISGNSRLVLD